MTPDDRAALRMAEFDRHVEHLRTDYARAEADPSPSWSAAVDVAETFMRPVWDRFWSKPSDVDALLALAVIAYCVGERPTPDTVVSLFERVVTPNRTDPEDDQLIAQLTAAERDRDRDTVRHLEQRRSERKRRQPEDELLPLITAALTAAGHDPSDGDDPVAKAWGRLTYAPGPDYSAPEHLWDTAFPEMFGDPRGLAPIVTALPTMMRAVAGEAAAA